MNQKPAHGPAIHAGRSFMKSPIDDENYTSDQQKRLPQPPLTLAARSAARIPLTRDFSHTLQERDYEVLVNQRVSHRFYADAPLTMDQLAFLLWSTQGVKSIRGNQYATLRTVPSGGGRHAYETYLAVRCVEGLEPGIYHYLPMEHALEPIAPGGSDIGDKMVYCAADQKWVGAAGVTFLYTVVPYRGEWRYDSTAHRVMLMDAGHIVQNLYLSCQAIGCGTCAVAAFRQAETDAFLGVDGVEEFTVYMAPVGLRNDAQNEALNRRLYADVQK